MDIMDLPRKRGNFPVILFSNKVTRHIPKAQKQPAPGANPGAFHRREDDDDFDSNAAHQHQNLRGRRCLGAADS